MKPKTKKLWMAYLQFTPTEFETTNFYVTKEELVGRTVDSFLSKATIIQVEIDERNEMPV